MLKISHVGSRTWKVIYQLATALGAMACVLVWLGIKPEDVRSWNVALTLPHWLWLVGAICLFVFSVYSSLRSFRYRPSVGDENNSDRKLFICANGYPLTRIQSGIALNLQILSSVPTKLVYAKATLTSQNGYQGQTHQIDLESSEPHIIPAMQMFNRTLEVKLAPEEAKRFMGPNVEIRGFLKLEENNKHQPCQFQLVTHREESKRDDSELRALQTELQKAQTAIATLNKPPDDLHLQLLCFQAGTTLSLEERAYFIRLKISCDDDTGIKAIEIRATIGKDVFTAEPMDSIALSEWLIRIPVSNSLNRYHTFREEELTSNSLWGDLQRNGLRSGLVKEGWMGIKISKGVLEKLGDPSQLQIDVIKSKDRNPLPFTFSALSECEGFHVFHRAYRTS